MKNHLLLIVSTLFILSLCVVSCQNQDQYILDSIPSPEEGRANISGRLQLINQTNIKGISVWVTPIYRSVSGEGVYALDTSSNPYTLTDEDGYFLFEDIEPGEYILFIGDPMTKFAIVTDDNGEVRVWDILPNETNDLGVISIDF
ncbi:MAG: hypothetical protein K0B14_18735 [Anaerolineaceae bacterium]|nr:hypothetical protein [Anaerolineaceae bacterium]